MVKNVIKWCLKWEIQLAVRYKRVKVKVMELVKYIKKET